MEVDERQLEQAIAVLRSILRDTPNSPRALLLLGRAHELAGSQELAQEHYLKAARAGKMAPAFAMPYGAFLLKHGQSDRAAGVAEDVLRVAPGHVPAMKLLAQVRINKGDWAGAQAVADELRKMGVAASTSEQITGVVQAARKNYAESIAAFKRAYQASPSDVQPMVTVVRGYLAANKLDDALGFVNAVIKASPDNLEARILQGQLYVLKGDQAASTKSFLKAIEMQPKDPRGYLSLANLHMRASRFAEADKVIDQGLARCRMTSTCGLPAPACTMRSGRIEDAIRLNERLLRRGDAARRAAAGRHTGAGLDRLRARP